MPAKKYFTEDARRQGQRKYHQKHKREHNVYVTARLKKHPEKAKDKYFKREYGISFEEHKQILVAQNNQCAMCGSTGRLFVDHDHHQGAGNRKAVRGLLCYRCNRYILGNRTLKQIEQSHKYLLNPPAQRVLK